MSHGPNPEEELLTRPGALQIPEGSPPPRIRLFDFDADGVEELEVDDVELLRPYAETTRTTWIDVQGLGDEGQLRRIGEIFGLHRLALGDAVNVPQRAKADLYDEHLLVIGRAPVGDSSGGLGDPPPQVCMIVGRGYLVSFQERSFGFFEGVRDRIRAGGGVLRTGGPGYLAAQLLAALVDAYYPINDEIAQALDDAEEKLLEDPTPDGVAEIHRLQRRITTLRRVARPQAEVLRRLSTQASPFVTEETLPYLRDSRDSAEQILGRLDAAREVAADTMAAMLATLGHRQNEVMKVLTLVGSIFIPLTFVAGIYGMNFQHMPELGYRWGYPIAIAGMITIAVVLLVLFRRRGWLGSRGRRD